MGKPPVFNRTGFLPEFIGQEGHTRGTETSQYPEEEKAIAISQVAASEQETAQTGRLAFRGCRTLIWELQKNGVSEAAWKGLPEKVKAL